MARVTVADIEKADALLDRAEALPRGSAARNSLIADAEALFDPDGAKRRAAAKSSRRTARAAKPAAPRKHPSPTVRLPRGRNDDGIELDSTNILRAMRALGVRRNVEIAWHDF